MQKSEDNNNTDQIVDALLSDCDNLTEQVSSAVPENNPTKSDTIETAEESHDCPINLEIAYERGIDEELIKLVFPGFVEDTKGRVEGFAQALQTNDVKQMRSLAHAIKGSAANIGADDLSEVSLQMQKACDENNLEPLPNFYQQLLIQWDRVLKYAIRQQWIADTVERTA